MLGVKRVLASMAGDVTPGCYSPAAVFAVFAVVVGALALLAGVACAVVTVAIRLRRHRERRAVDRLIGSVARPARFGPPFLQWLSKAGDRR